MNIDDALRYGRWMLNQHPLVSHYSVEIFDFKAHYPKMEDWDAYAWCFFYEERIELNERFVSIAKPELVKSIMGHEVGHALAHAMCGKTDHGKEWETITRALGGLTKPCLDWEHGLVLLSDFAYDTLREIYYEQHK